MKIKWLGHACCLITSDSGTRIVLDPFKEYVGYKLPEVEADIVTTSHAHDDHNNVEIIKGDYTHIGEPGSFDVDGIEITGVSTFHDEAGGAKRGKNIVYKFTVDGIRVCHCGDLGHLPDESQLKELGEIDILLVPVGGVYTIDAKEAAKLVGMVKPKIVIPMHFQTGDLKFKLDGVEKFLETLGGGERPGKQEIDVSPGILGEITRVIVLEYK